MSHVFVYEGQKLGGPPPEEFVEAVRREGAPLSADRYSQVNYTYGMLHQAPLFTTLDRRKWVAVAITRHVPSQKCCERLAT
jgi:hypothetical protein